MSDHDHLTKAQIGLALDRWRSSILAEVRNEATASEKRVIECCMAAIAPVLIAERAKLRVEIETEILKLRAEFLQGQLDAERGVRRLKPVG